MEVWFSILSRAALRGASFRSVRELREAIDAFIVAHNQTAAPFEWTKVKAHSKCLASEYSSLCKQMAVISGTNLNGGGRTTTMRCW